MIGVPIHYIGSSVIGMPIHIVNPEAPEDAPIVCPGLQLAAHLAQPRLQVVLELPNLLPIALAVAGAEKGTVQVVEVEDLRKQVFCSMHL